MYYSILICMLGISCCMLSLKAGAQDRFEEIHYPFKVQKLSLSKGQEIAYMEMGKGEVILAIHGLASYAPAWKYNMEALAKHYRVIAVDLLGYGKSSKGKFSANMSFHVEHLEGFLSQLGINKAHLLGHSMGAQIAMTFALQYPEKTLSLSLMAPAGIETFSSEQKAFFASVTPEAVANTPDAQYRQNLALNFYAFNEKAEFMYADRMQIKQDALFQDYCYVVAQGIQGMLNEPVFDRLPELKLPVLVVYGSQDALIPNRYLNPQWDTQKIAARAQEQMPHAKVQLVEQAGHFVMFEQPDQVNYLILDFLRHLKGPR